MYSDFDWAKAPLSSFSAPCIASASYLVIVFLLPKIVPKGGFKGMEPILVAHNAILSIWSVVMFLGCFREMMMRAKNDGADWMFCEQQQTATGALYFWSYIFYVSKYYEMVDTILALLKGSSPPHFGLHVYHHSCVPFMTWYWLHSCATLQFPGLLFNTFVHIIMYAYYAMKVMKLPTPWKSWITRLQILQFMTSVVLLGVSWFGYLEGQWLNPKCQGMQVLWVNIAFNMTLLWQFVGVLFTNTKKAAGKEVKKAN